MQWSCDVCHGAGVYVVTEIASGAVKCYCAAHYQGGPVGAAEPPVPDLCEMCGQEPPVGVQIALSDGSRQALCSRCLMLVSRLTWIAAPPEVRQVIEQIVGGDEPPAEPEAPRGRRRGRAVSLAEYQQAAGMEPIEAGVEDGVAVDPEGEAAELEPEA
jgi:hypothetical protein